MGSSIVGKPTCASTEPSTNSTNACTTDCGCATTSTAGYGNANRKCASITSSALLTRVAESTVIFFPMRHVGWRSASSTVAPATRSGVQVRNGPPDAVRMSRSSSVGRRPVMHWSTALRSEEHTSELQSQSNLVCRLLLEKKKIDIMLLPMPICEDNTLGEMQ